MHGNKKTVLIMEPESENLEILKQAIYDSCCPIHLETATNIESALKLMCGTHIHVVIARLLHPNCKSLDLLRQLHKQEAPPVSVACLPAGDQCLVVQALEAGFNYYINTPFHKREVEIIIKRVLKASDLMLNIFDNQHLRNSDGFQGMIGSSKKMTNLFNTIKKIAHEGNSTVLIQGQSGVGKELVAKAIHNIGPRRKENFVPINCAAIPEELLESELFGYVKGAFTGANQSKEGRISYAHKGTLLLDEIGDMSLPLQAKLLRVLQEREFEPVGSVKPRKVNVRVVAATKCDLEKQVEDGTFREDLYYRLNVIPVEVPSLQERSEDIPLLLKKFIKIGNRYSRSSLKDFSPGALEALKEYSWPGNIRELKNLVQRLSILLENDVADIHHLPEKILRQNGLRDPQPITMPENSMKMEKDFKTQVGEFEDRLILQALITTKGNKKQAAKKLNLKRTTLLEKIKKKDLDNFYSQHILR